MAETPSKRLRETETESEDSQNDSNTKRQKPYTNILNLLDDSEPPHEPSHEDISAIFSILQQELADPPPSTAADDLSLHSTDDVMRHLLEASDDELGIPNPRDENENSSNFVEDFNSGENFPFVISDNGLWDLEDEAANYYTVLQSELFM